VRARAMDNFFSVKNVAASYGDNKILKDVSFSLERGEVVGIIGLNGSGKSTLLKCILNDIKYNGDIQIDGKNLNKIKLKELAKLVAYIPQSDSIDLSLTVLDVVLMGFHDALSLFASPKNKQKELAKATLKSVGLGGFEERDYLNLSGGEKQLCLLARTLVRDCPLLIMDEPDSSLDAKNKATVLNLVKAKVKENNRALLIALHDVTFALNFCDKLLLLKDGTILSQFNPRKTEIPQIQLLLSAIYGNIEIGEIKGDKTYLAAITH
jgi:iron complex transport system ATP-binding protein